MLSQSRRHIQNRTTLSRRKGTHNKNKKGKKDIVYEPSQDNSSMERPTDRTTTVNEVCSDSEIFRSQGSERGSALTSPDKRDQLLRALIVDPET